MAASNTHSIGVTHSSSSLSIQNTKKVTTNPAQLSLSTTFLRSVGLKILTLQRALTSQIFPKQKEEEKILISKSRKIASARVAVHILPMSITMFLIAFNAVELLNGPQITASATFFLQLAAKFHELTISGSLTLIVLDVIRNELLREGITFGMLTSAYTITGLNFLWSPNFWTFILTARWSMRKLCLCLIVAVCCVMTAIVGPASALLCIPTESWMPYGWTHFYLNGTDSDHWPSQLAARHAGPDFCLDFDKATFDVCAAGGFEFLRPRLTLYPLSTFHIPVYNGGYSNIMDGNSPWIDPTAPHKAFPESWVMAPKMDVTCMLQNLSFVYDSVQAHATGRNKRLRDYVDGSYIISPSKIVVGRAICGPPQLVNESTKSLPFPVLPSDHRWRNLSYSSFTQQQWGPLLDHDVEGLHSYNVTSTAKLTQARTKWVNLGFEYGAATTGVAVISQNPYMMVARGCTLDYRWATGQTWREYDSQVNAFQAQIGKPTSPSDSQSYYERRLVEFPDPRMIPYLGDTIKANEDWLDAAFPVHVLASEPSGYNMTTLEAILDGTEVAYPDYAVTNDTVQSFEHLAHTEQIITVLFADALTRTGLYLSLINHDVTQGTIPLLTQPSNPKDPQLLLRGGDIYLKPGNTPYIPVKVEWYTYGVAWTLRDYGQYLAVAVLCVHILLAIIHTLVVITSGTSMDAWDSITDLLLLTWNSVPTRRDHEFQNCSVGVYGVLPLEQQVKAAVVENPGEFEGRVELIVIDEKGVNKDGRRAHNIQPGWTYR